MRISVNATLSNHASAVMSKSRMMQVLTGAHTTCELIFGLALKEVSLVLRVEDRSDAEAGEVCFRPFVS
jgi:hypothetical protein